ncbi:MAG: tRNA (adenosine(37)-N6)-threonylcarbamoyltransferase complex transferase subunit TsaD [Sutterellaceae bacterium]|nr:tRNA (adenosine(37)-N6)-threonylcarbamoyltransferase complex transferase subunit TsaD [Burkholderiaceae bacterium]MCX7900812.1 tRNA (adenosine(37)-N6)-threonylcarbamoyltransferase complex transferase subunit TsaD [Burkholderiaceae bacterium]MDW8430481.1 tRNA (adenosine(37)-N6)-threonylcarbamoyltransferase complex transferase subunit TsaD [Sutterellaceae bacterium]
MIVLGIETSCDETGIALLDEHARVLAQALHSQVELHGAYGGVVPELAARDHIRRVLPLLEQCLQQAGCSRSDIEAIAVTVGPGLAGALLVGASIAYGLGYALSVPVIGVHHMEGHLLSPLLSEPAPRFPFVALLVSGGHTQLMQVERVGGYVLLGETLDDAAGEAFDKTAQLLGLGYPGGPAVSRLARQGVPGTYHFPRPLLTSGDLNFSFSGLKTAVLTAVRQRDTLSEQAKADIARAFVDAVVDVLVAKSLAALRLTGLRRLVVAGGVGANLQLREQLAESARKHELELYFPPAGLCTDNGAMIALAGLMHLRAGQPPARWDFEVRPRWPLASH